MMLFSLDCQPVSDWKLQLPDSVPLAEVRQALPCTDDGNLLAQALVAARHAKGILSVTARIHPETKVIELVQSVPTPRGKYALYLDVHPGQPLLQSDLDAALVRAEGHAASNQERLTVSIANDDGTGHADVTIDGAANGAPASTVTLIGTTTGPRYASADVVTLAGSRQLGDGAAVNGSVSKGIADLRADSKGGAYNGVAGEFKKTTYAGVMSMRASHTTFKVGGVNLPLDQNGSVDKAEVEWSYSPTAHFSAFTRLAYTRQQSKLLGLFDDTVGTSAIIGGLQYQDITPSGSLQADVSIEHGLQLSRSINAPSPLLGDVNQHYSVLTANVARTFVLPKDWSLALKTGAQIGSDGTPPSSQFYIGGPDRGAAYNTGVYSGSAGAYASGLFTGPNLGTYPAWGVRSMRATFGSDGGVVKAKGVPSSTTLSLGAGMQFGLDHGNAALALALPVKDKTGGHKPRLVAFLSWSF